MTPGEQAQSYADIIVDEDLKRFPEAKVIERLCRLSFLAGYKAAITDLEKKLTEEAK